MSSIKLGMDLIEQIDQAIDNGWMLRPCSSSAFVNINHAKKIKLENSSHILSSADEMEKYPPGITCVALIAHHLVDVNFVSLDFDFKNESLKKVVWELLSHYKVEDLFIRIGNRDKIGQIWFQTESQVRHRNTTQFDVITTEKRCNAIGLYKTSDSLLYEWPYKNPWDNSPEDLPFIPDELITEILNVVASHFGKVSKDKSPLGSRHDNVKENIFKNMNKPGFLNIIQDVINSPDYISACNERDFKSEAKRMLSWAAEQVFDNYNDISGLFSDDKNELFDDFLIDEFPKVEKNSFIDIFYRATKRNQYSHNKKLAFFTALSVSSWLLTFSTRYEGMAPNLMILYIAHSGSGKSTTSRAIKELIKLYKDLQQSYMGGDIRTESSLLNALESAPNPYYLIDEFTKIVNSKNSNSSFTSNIIEILCQLYSDYNDTDIHQVRLKNSSYGVCFGPKMNMIGFSTSEFWNVFSESDFSQGLGRRVLIINDETVSFAKRDMVYQKNFFKNNELQLIKLFIDKFVYMLFPYGPKDISSYGLTKGVDKKGDEVMWEEAISMMPRFELTSSIEVSEYFKGKFIDKLNELKKRSLSSGNNLNLYVVNSMPEFVKKFAMIHTMSGKSIITKDEDGISSVPVRTTVEMDSVDWAEKMFMYYMIHGLSYDLESIYRKDEVGDEIIDAGDRLVEKLIEKDVLEFMISNSIIKSFFRVIKSDKFEIINNLLIRGKVELISKGASKRGKKYRVVIE